MEKSLAESIKDTFMLSKVDIRAYSPLTLAYIGDSIFDLIIRTMLVEKGNAQVNQLHQRASRYVKASSQKELFHSIEGILTEEELSWYKRGRNAKSFTTAKNCTLSDYKTATGLEALFGYLYLTEKVDRILDLVKKGFINLGWYVVTEEELKSE